jgi:superfamily II DNA/RNA helicase
LLVCHSAAHPPPAPQLDYSLMETQALVLGPTRELAQQIEKVR